MEARVWSEDSGLAYHFFQWVRLCDELIDMDSENVFSPSASFAFPSQDFELKSPHSMKIEIYFLSLLGAMSPLPHHFNMPMLSSSSEAQPFYAFISMLNAIFYRALYASWKANHLHLFTKTRAMFHEMFSPYASTPWLARPVLQHTPTMTGLCALLYRLSPNVAITVSQEIGFHMISIGLPRLSDRSPKRLSDNTILGGRVLSQEGRLVLAVGALPCAHARDWLPSGVFGARVLKHVKQYLGVSYQLTWIVTILSQQSLTCLGQHDALSCYAFLGKSSQRLSIVKEVR